MDKDKDLLNPLNRENGLTSINRAIYQKFIRCRIPSMIAAKPAYNLAQIYIQAFDFVAKTNELVKLDEATDIAEKVLETRESVKSLRYFADRFSRGYYVLMDKLNAFTESLLSEDDEEVGELTDPIEETLSVLNSDDLRRGMNDELEAHARQQFSAVVKKLIAKGCSEDTANYFAENLFELKTEATNFVSRIDYLISLDGDFESFPFDVEEILVEISIPWVGFSPGETAHALWHIGDHDDDNFFFMGFLGWSLAVLENLQENIEDL